MTSEGSEASALLPPRQKGTRLAIGLAVLAVVIVGGLFGLSRLNVGDQRASTHVRRPDRSTTTTSPRPVTSTTISSEPIAYRVRSGDTLNGIARRFGVSTAAILTANRLKDPNHLTVGETLTVPPPPPLRLIVAPATASVGDRVRFVLTGAKAGERITFVIGSATGAPYSGPPHVAPTNGKVVAEYTPESVDSIGAHTVTALGNQGTTTAADFVVVLHR